MSRTIRRRRTGNYKTYKQRHYVPSEQQYLYCIKYLSDVETDEQANAFTEVINAYPIHKSIPHAFIHIVNVSRRDRNEVKFSY